MVKKIVAVSGGVDSVVLLDMLAAEYRPDQLVVAHFEHGIRGEDSKYDARFVECLSREYGVEFEIGHGNLSKHASEADARKLRYEFLHSVAKKHDGIIVTAHHQDDLVETVALNIIRGTGWRGLAVFGNNKIERPLLHLAKKDLYNYALGHDLEWVEDLTNQSDVYTRNRLRRILWKLTDQERSQLVALYRSQQSIRTEIDHELDNSESVAHSRYFMTMISKSVALEILRRLTDSRLTRPQMGQLLLSIKTAQPGTSAQVGGGLSVEFTSRYFSVELL